MQAGKARVFNWVPLVTVLLAASCLVTPKTYPVGGKTQKPDAGSVNESDDDTAECIPGEESCECFRNGTCDDGLACVSDRCVDLNSLSDDDTDDDSSTGDDADDDTGDDTTDPADDTLSDDTLSDDTLSDDTLSDDTLSDDTLSDDTLSDDTLSDDTLSDDTADPGDDALADDTTGDDTAAPDDVDANPADDEPTDDAADDASVGDDTSEPDDTTFWASWPMPNPASSGLPNPASYTIDEAAGVVTDDVTGLMWQRSVASSSYAWEAAVAHCDSLSLGGYDDWRLPSRIELVSLLDYTRSSPAIDVTAFPNTPSAYFWTPSAIVSFENSRVSMYRDDSLRGSQRNLVRCVRTHEVQSGSTVERYTVEGDSPDDQVTDNRTGLVWQRMASSSTYNWDTAQAYCTELSLGGVTGWRVPSVKELLTIVDDARRNPAIDPLAFPDTPISTFMTGSLVSGYSPYSPAVLRVEFGGGDTSEYYRSNSAQLRCVR